MKIIIKALSIGAIGFLISICLIKTINVTTMINELNNASAIAMENTQRIMQSVIINREYGFKENQYAFGIGVSGEAITYGEYYEKCFLDNVKNKGLYKLSIFSDYDYGIIYVQIENSYSKLIPTKTLINIIDIEDNE